MQVEVKSGSLLRFVSMGLRVRDSFAEAERALNSEVAQLLIQEIQERAPKDTGAYSNSYSSRYTGKGYRVSTRAPQARRLEYGFNGEDSLGRNYNVAPKPHVRPAVEAVIPVARAMYINLIRRTFLK